MSCQTQPARSACSSAFRSSVSRVSVVSVSPRAVARIRSVWIAFQAVRCAWWSFGDQSPGTDRSVPDVGVERPEDVALGGAHRAQLLYQCRHERLIITHCHDRSSIDLVSLSFLIITYRDGG